ncbi:MAG: hypothetical protein H0T17_08955 [Propionibacteriales bacterium]|nr:hypothetical protein [Propionibacteriales bacterium]
MPSKRSNKGVTSLLALGVKDLPRNTSWLLSKALSPVDGAKGAASASKDAASSAGSTASHGIVDTVRSAGASLKDVLPGSSDSVELRLQRARAATERARESEDRAFASAEEAKARTSHAKETAERDKAHLRDVKRDQSKLVEQRVAEARRDADAQVDEAHKEAQSEADEVIESEETEAKQRLQKARDEAEDAQAKAKADLSDATSKLAEARQLADEATAAAQAAADEAHQQAKRLAATAHHDAESADQVVAEAERVRASSSATATVVTKRLKKADTAVDFDALSKQELLDLAKAKGVDGRSSMSKNELVSVLKKSR